MSFSIRNPEMEMSDMARFPDDRGSAVADLDGREISPLDQISAVVDLLFEAGLALNSIQRSPMSDHDTSRTTDAVAALDNALQRLRVLAITLSLHDE